MEDLKIYDAVDESYMHIQDSKAKKDCLSLNIISEFQVSSLVLAEGEAEAFVDCILRKFPLIRTNLNILS